MASSIPSAPPLYFFPPFTLCNEESSLLHICWKQSFSMMHPSHSLPLSVTLSCTHNANSNHTGRSHPSLPPQKKKKGLGKLSPPPPHSVLLWWLPSFLWACRDLLDIPLIYGSYIICSNIVHRATACLLVSLSVVITQLEGRVEDWARGRKPWYMYDRWIRHSIDEWTVLMWEHQLLQITCMHLYGPIYAFECVLQIMCGWVSLCRTVRSWDYGVSVRTCGQHSQKSSVIRDGSQEEHGGGKR